MKEKAEGPPAAAAMPTPRPPAASGGEGSGVSCLVRFSSRRTQPAGVGRGQSQRLALVYFGKKSCVTVTSRTLWLSGSKTRTLI